MRRIGLWLASTVVILALLMGYHTSTSGVLTTSSQTPFSSGPTAGAAGAAAQPASKGAGSNPAGHTKQSALAATSKTYTGSVAQTRYGPVQVAIDVKSGTITKASVLQYPNAGGMDQRINSYALPILVDSTVKAQSAQVQMVSGATYTSDGYLTSLQSALDQAGL